MFESVESIDDRKVGKEKVSQILKMKVITENHASNSEESGCHTELWSEITLGL